ncbi:MAG: carbohydrate-binding domain-containing protein, partial [Oscillospiraceae bacterium]|nr:carbohydrate-binding domain-containing protein [Oscillospiraceae bacterium]
GRINAVDLALLKRLLLSSGGQSDDPQPSSRYVTQITYAENAVTLKNADGAVISPDQAENVTVENGTVVTVTKPTDAGEISADGECSQGQLRIDVDKTAYPDAQVAVSLRGLTLANSSDSPIYAASVGDELVLTVKKDTVNTISDGTSYQNADGSAGAVYACDDLKIKGKGTLIVNGNCEDGIVSKDDLKLWNGNLQVNAADDGIRGKDSVRIGDPDAAEGYDSLSVTVKTTGGDGIKSTGTDEGKGFVRINGGTVTIDSYLDGISGEQSVEINGGTITIDSSDDCLHGGGDLFLYGGCMMLQTADDGVHSDHSLTVGETAGAIYDNVQIIVTKGYEGLEAQHIIQNSGTVIAHVTDDGFNAGGGNDGSGNQGGFNPWGGGGRGGFSSGGDYSLTFNGGFALVDVENSGDHDGIDSNSSITVTGGIIITNGNQPFDYGAESGGKLSFSNNAVWIENSRTSHYMETQPNYTVTGGSTAQGQRISLIGSDGKVIVSFIAGKQVTVLRAGGNVSGAKFCTGGTLSADTTYFQTAYSDQLAAYGGTLSGGTASSGSGRT